MQTVRRLIIVFSCLICLWVFVSVGGLFLDPGRVEFWSSSLMWSLLSSLLVAPALVMAFTGSGGNTHRSASTSQGQRSRSQPTETRRDRSDSDNPQSQDSPSSFFEESGGAYPVSEPTDK